MSNATDNFVKAFNDLQTDVYKTAQTTGWWDGDEHNQGEKIALMHSELSEALEAIRVGNPPDDKIPNFTGAEAELADVVIRIMDAAEHWGWDVASAIQCKVDFNKKRSHRHGGKKF